MKNLFVSLFLLLATGGFALAQKTINDPNAEKRSVSGFHGIEVANGIHLYLSEGSSEEVAVSASTTEFRDKIVTKVENGILKIHYESKWRAFNKKKESKNLKAYVSYKMLDLLEATTGAEVEINDALSLASLALKANTGAMVNGNVSIGNLKISQSTGSKITLSGKAAKMDVEGSTGSKFTGEDLNAVTCNVSVSTGAKVWVRAEKELQVNASTGGTVKYKGDASIREIKTSTGGSVSRI